MLLLFNIEWYNLGGVKEQREEDCEEFQLSEVRQRRASRSSPRRSSQ